MGTSMLWRGDRAGLRRDIALLGALCLFLSALEYMIPKPLPFFRIGLANLPLLIALDILPLGAFMTLVLLKITGQALITGTLFSYIFLLSLAGTLCSALVMYGMRRSLGEKRISLTGTGIAGALVSNVSQLLLAGILMFGPGVKYMAPVFLGAGTISGALLGYFAEGFAARSRWYRMRRCP